MLTKRDHVGESVRQLPFNLSDRDGLARRLVVTSVGSIGVRLFGMGMTFLVGVQLAHYLGPAELGVYGTVTAVVAILTVLAQLGLPQLITREISAGLAKGEQGKVRGILVWFTLAVALASLVMSAAGALLYLTFRLVVADTWSLDSPSGINIDPVYFWGLATIPLTALIALGMGALRGYHKIVRSQLYDTLIRPALMAAMLLAVMLVAGSINAATAMALQVVAASVALVACWLQVARATPAIVYTAKTVRTGSKWARSALPMSGSEILRVVDGNYPLLLLGVLAAIHDVGVFRVALSAAVLVGFPSALVNIIAMPYFAQWHAEGKSAKLQLMATLTSVLMFTSASAITFLIYLFGVSFLTAVFGVAFSSAWSSLVLIGVSYMVSGFFGSAAMLLNMSNQERTVTLVYAVGPVVGVIITVTLFPVFGIVAAAIAMIICETIKGLWMAFAARRSLGINLSLLSIAGIARYRGAVASKTEANCG